MYLSLSAIRDLVRLSIDEVRIACVRRPSTFRLAEHFRHWHGVAWWR